MQIPPIPNPSRREGNKTQTENRLRHDFLCLAGLVHFRGQVQVVVLSVLPSPGFELGLEFFFVFLAFAEDVEILGADVVLEELLVVAGCLRHNFLLFNIIHPK
jgi:hypothetical protein